MRTAARPGGGGNHNKASPSRFKTYARIVLVAVGLAHVVATFCLFGSSTRLQDRAVASLREAFPDFYAPSPSVDGAPLGGNNATDGTGGAVSGGSGVHFAYHRHVSDILRSNRLPEWVKAYAAWHASQRRKFVRSTDGSFDDVGAKNVRFLVVRCLTNDKCGGASDRLQDMPYNLMVANRTGRVLLVKWERPAALERFLLPPPGGIDWTIPEGMAETMSITARGKEESDAQLVSVTRRDSAAPIFREYEKILGHHIYHEFFRLLFTPSKELSTRIETTMNALHLTPKQYSSVHLRVKYPVAGIEEATFTFQKHRDKITAWAINAINCAAELHPRSTIYVSSDNNDTVAYLLEESHFAQHAAEHAAAAAAGKEPQPLVVKLVSRDYSTENPHVEFAKDVEADGFMCVFEDLMIMGLGKCVAHGPGGFGRLAAALSGGECVQAHRGRHAKTCSDAITKKQESV